LRHKPAAHLGAYDLLLRAQQLEYEFTPESLAAAIEHASRALAIDSSYAPAMALGAHCYTFRRLQGWAQNITEESTEGARLAVRAVEFGQGDGNVLWMSGHAVWHFAMDAGRAKELVSRSLAVNPNSAMALTVLAWIETCSNANPTKGLELFRRAERLSPLDPRGWFISAGVAAVHFVQGRLDETISSAQKALFHNPRFAVALRFLAASLARQGRADEATVVVREILKLEPDLTLTKLRARLMFLDDSYWSRYSEGLRGAGVPE
jgi:tetratricopeptide (TPR) repeat protein